MEFATFVTLFMADEETDVGLLIDESRITSMFGECKPDRIVWLDPERRGPSPEDQAQLIESLGYALASPFSGKVRRMEPAEQTRGWPAPGGR